MHKAHCANKWNAVCIGTSNLCFSLPLSISSPSLSSFSSFSGSMNQGVIQLVNYWKLCEFDWNFTTLKSDWKYWFSIILFHLFVPGSVFRIPSFRILLAAFVCCFTLKISPLSIFYFTPISSNFFVAPFHYLSTPQTSSFKFYRSYCLKHFSWDWILWNCCNEKYFSS